MTSAILIIAKNTFRELVRGKTLYAVLFVSVLIVACSALFGSVSVGDTLTVVKDFGLFSISFFAVVFSVITGASLLQKELERKTVYNILSKPVQRWQFVLGKFLGMYAAQIVFLVLASLALTTYASFYDGHFDLKILYASAFFALEILIICAATLFFASIVVTPLLNGLFSFGLFLAGRSVDYIKTFQQQLGENSGVFGKFLDLLYYILPQLPKLNQSNQVVLGTLPAPEMAFWSSLYAVCYAAILLIIASVIFSRREFN